MAEFDDIRGELRRARAALEAAADAAAAAGERVARGAADEAELERARAAAARAAAAERELRERFAVFTDPRKGIANLDDATPILLMPVRLETRFKEFSRGEAKAHELWVRVYPDDCWIDGFDPGLTESEVLDARAYWVGIWQAGGIEDQERGAWRMLAGAHGSGRAAWVVEQFQPLPDPPRPVKPRPEDVVLTVPVDARLPAGEERRRRDLVAGGLASQTVTRRRRAGAPSARVGRRRAARRGDRRRAAAGRLRQPAPGGRRQGPGRAQVAFVVFPAVETKRQPWTRAPRMRVLPDRFVFIGYRGDEPPLVRVGAPVPSTLFVGPDPSAPESEQLRHDADGNLIVPEELRWLTDFPPAVSVGMAFRDPAHGRAGEHGVRPRARRRRAAQRGQGRWAGRPRDAAAPPRASRKGLALIPQGTPTNNTEAVGAAHSRLDDPDESFDDAARAAVCARGRWLDKRDGQWLAELLGVDAAGARARPRRGRRTSSTRARCTALWPATLGYWMETMMAPVFARAAIDADAGVLHAVRQRARRGAGDPHRLAALRHPAGDGVLAPRVARRVTRREARPARRPYLRALHALLRAVRPRLAGPRRRRVRSATPGDDPHATAARHPRPAPGSVECAQRYAADAADALRPPRAGRLAGSSDALDPAVQPTERRDLLPASGRRRPRPPILELISSARHNALTGRVVDDRAALGERAIRAYTDDGRNYLAGRATRPVPRWTSSTAKTASPAGGRRTALLYLLLRHALQLGYHDDGRRLHVVPACTRPTAVRARADDPFLHVRTAGNVSESKYQPLYAFEPAITGERRAASATSSPARAAD